MLKYCVSLILSYIVTIATNAMFYLDCDGAGNDWSLRPSDRAVGSVHATLAGHQCLMSVRQTIRKKQHVWQAVSKCPLDDPDQDTASGWDATYAAVNEVMTKPINYNEITTVFAVNTLVWMTGLGETDEPENKGEPCSELASFPNALYEWMLAEITAFVLHQIPTE